MIRTANPIPDGPSYARDCADAWEARRDSRFELDAELAHEASEIPSIAGDPESAALDRELVATLGFPEFIRRAWQHVPIFGNAEYVPTRLIAEMARHCEAHFWGEYLDLLINVPPSSAKSVVCSVLYPVWIWTIDPSFMFICASFEHNLARDLALRSQSLIQSEWYKERFGNLMPELSYQATNFTNVLGGVRFSTTPGGAGIGRRANMFIADDPIKPASAEELFTEPAIYAKVENWLRGTMSTRYVDAETYRWLMVMQRLDQRDPSQVLIDRGAVHLRLPQKFEPEAKCVTPIGGDWRTRDGEILVPERDKPETIERNALNMGGWSSLLVAAQYQQRPAPVGGALFKSDHFQTFLLRPDPERPELSVCKFEDTVSIVSVDCTFKDTPTSDYVAIEVWGTTDGKFYCFDSVLEHLDLDGTINAIMNVLDRWPATFVVVEDKANGPEVIKALERKGLIVEAYTPTEKKEGRAQVAALFYSARAVYHLDAPWRERKEANLMLFPRGRHDDDVDATSQAVIKLRHMGMADFLAAMRASMNE